MIIADANASPDRIIPVLDLMQGQVVRGIAGRRDEYRPIVSKLVDSTEPLTIAQLFRERFGFNELYLADLDAIRFDKPALDIYCRLQADGFRSWIDAGVRTSQDEVLISLGEHADSIVVGLESVRGPDELTKLVQRFGAARIVFSLDMMNGMPVYRQEFWQQDFSWPLVEYVVAHSGVRRVIVLDLAQVGTDTGVDNQCAWCKRLKEWPDIEVTTGGGVRNMEDVRRLLAAGADRVLVASALHDGRITPAEVRQA